MAEICLDLHPRQWEAFNSPATEILFGGAAGGGKSHLQRIAALAWAVQIPGLQVFIFRRTFPELMDTHVHGPRGFLALLAPWIADGQAKFNVSALEITFPKQPKPSIIKLCHCQYEQTVYQYQGAEMHVLMVDELTHFSEPMYQYLRSRVRMAGLDVPPVLAPMFPRIVNTTNPGGIGHNWVKAAFVDPAQPHKCWRTPMGEGGLLRQFIPSKLSDNPTLTQEDPHYLERLEGLGNPEMVRALRDGDWNIVAGGALDDVWKPAAHIVAPFPIPPSWRIDRSFDWGSSRPFAVCWWAESDGTTIKGAPALPKGSLVQIAELYGWNGRVNEGSRRIAAEVARAILQAEEQMGIKGLVRPGPADSAIFASENGVCIADDMARVGVRWEESEKGPGSRVNGLERVRKYLAAGLQSPPEGPVLKFFDTCRHSLRTLPTLPRDKRKPEDVDTEAEDHVYDAVRYRIMAQDKRVAAVPRPWG